MKAIVCVKQVVDANIKVRANASGTNVDIDSSKKSINPFDETALEEASLLKEQGILQEIIAICIGGDKASDVLRQAIARGCTKAILIKTEQQLDPINIAKVLASIITKEQAQLILLGKKAIDDEASQVAGMLCGILDYPQANSISKLKLVNTNTIEVDCEVDNGVEVLELDLPAIVSVDLSLNEPRFIKLPQIMLAKKHPIEIIELDSLGLELNISTKLVKVTEVSMTKACNFLTDANDIINILKQKKVI